MSVHGPNDPKHALTVKIKLDGQKSFERIWEPNSKLGKNEFRHIIDTFVDGNDDKLMLFSAIKTKGDYLP